MNDLTREILDDLYRIDPKLKNMESELTKIISEMVAAKPDTKFDEQFKQELKNLLMRRAEVLKKQLPTKPSNFMLNKKIYLAFGSLIVLIILIVPTVLILNNKKAGPALLALNIVQTEDQAFGNLFDSSANILANTTNEEADQNRVSKISGTASYDKTLLTDDGTETEMAIAPSIDTVIGLGGGGGINTQSITKADIYPAGNEIAIAPEYPGKKYHYVYTGEELNFDQSEMAVLKKQTSSFSGANLGNIINALKINLANLNKFSNGTLKNLSFVQDRPYGYNININLTEGSIYISENYEKWPGNSACYDELCWQQRRVQPADLLDDETVINIANDFIKEYGIDMSNYGQGAVNNDWRTYYEQLTDKSSYYLPDSVTVIYPLIIEGKEIYDDGGYPYGLNIGIKIKEKKVNYVSNLNILNFQSSLYPIVTDNAKLLTLAEQGGLYSSTYYPESAEIIDVEIGTPKLTYIKIWKYQDNGDREILVPALIFPVKNPPDNNFYKKNVVVPLVEDFFEQNQSDLPSAPIRILEAD